MSTIGSTLSQVGRGLQNGLNTAQKVLRTVGVAVHNTGRAAKTISREFGISYAASKLGKSTKRAARDFVGRVGEVTVGNIIDKLSPDNLHPWRPYRAPLFEGKKNKTGNLPRVIAAAA